jgi:hypothetical protein
MGKSSPHLIDPREAGLKRLELHHPLFDESAIARAEQMLQVLGGSMQQWLEADVARLQDLRAAAEHAGWSFSAQENLVSVAHDLKGMGETYGFPLVSQFSASLCRLLETDDGKSLAQKSPALACAHIDAIRAAVAGEIRSASDPVGGATLAALEAEVAKLGVAPL